MHNAHDSELTPFPTPLAWPGLDETDLAIIAAIQEDGRASMASVSRSIGQPVPRVKARFDRLSLGGILQTVALIDPIALGRPVVAHLDLLATGDNGALAARISKVPGVAWIGVGADHARLLVQVSVPSNADLVKTVNEHVRGEGDVQQVSLSIVLRSWSPRFAFTRPEPTDVADPNLSLWRTGFDHDKLLDSVDRSLLRCVEADARASLTAMSEATGLSVPATRQRLIKLTQDRTLQFRTRPDPRSDSVRAVRFLLDTEGQTDAVVQHLVRLPHVNFISESTGYQAVTLEVLAPDDTQIGHAYDQVSRVPGVVGVRMVRFQRILFRKGGW